MHKHTQHIFTKIGVISLGIIAMIQVGSFAIAQDLSENITQDNATLYKSAAGQSLSEVGIALSTGIGIRFEKRDSTIPVSYAEVTTVGKTSEESKAIRETLIEDNMIIIQEYLGLLKTDILGLLDSVGDRRNTLNGLISQLEVRFKNATQSEVYLVNQKSLLLADMNQIQTEIDAIKVKIGDDFSKVDSDATVQNVDEYLELRRRYTENFTDVVFINQFLVQYNFLNNYNKNLLDTLINNREAIISQSYVVIPDSGSEFLQKFRLLYNEADFKALPKEEE